MEVAQGSFSLADRSPEFYNPAHVATDSRQWHNVFEIQRVGNGLFFPEEAGREGNNNYFQASSPTC